MNKKNMILIFKWGYRSPNMDSVYVYTETESNNTNVGRRTDIFISQIVVNCVRQLVPGTRIP